MKNKKIKTVFVEGKMVTVNGKTYTKMYSKEEIEERKKSLPMSKEREEEISDRLEKKMKENNPELHKKLYPEQYK